MIFNMNIKSWLKYTKNLQISEHVMQRAHPIGKLHQNRRAGYRIIRWMMKGGGIRCVVSVVVNPKAVVGIFVRRGTFLDALVVTLVPCFVGGVVGTGREEDAPASDTSGRRVGARGG